MKQKFSLLLVIVLTTVISHGFVPGNSNANVNYSKQVTDEINGVYNITNFVYQGSDVTGNYSRYSFAFYKWWNRVEVFSGESEDEGKWYYNDNGLDLDFGGNEIFSILNGNWLIREQDDSHFVLTREDGSTVEFRLM